MAGKGFVLKPFDQTLLRIDRSLFQIVLTSRANRSTRQKSPIYSNKCDDPSSAKIVDHYGFPAIVISEIEVVAKGNSLFLTALTEVGWMNIATWQPNANDKWCYYMVVTTTRLAPDTPLSQQMCVVCMEDMSRENCDCDVVVLPCGHVFHTLCYEGCFTSARRVCPLCKNYSHLVCACGQCQLSWQLDGYICPTLWQNGRCDFLQVDCEPCPWGCPLQQPGLCPHIRDYFKRARGL